MTIGVMMGWECLYDWRVVMVLEIDSDSKAKDSTHTKVTRLLWIGRNILICQMCQASNVHKIQMKKSIYKELPPGIPGRARPNSVCIEKVEQNL